MFALAIVCSLGLSVDVATGSQPAFAHRASARQANGSKDGEEVFLNRCSNCHGTERALVAPRTRKGWEGVIADMVNNGAQLETGELEPMLAFLTERHGLEAITARLLTSQRFAVCPDSTSIGWMPYGSDWHFVTEKSHFAFKQRRSPLPGVPTASSLSSSATIPAGAGRGAPPGRS
jgi:hypothetical protein